MGLKNAPITPNAFDSITDINMEYHTQLAKMSFDEIFDLTAGVYFHFL